MGEGQRNLVVATAGAQRAHGLAELVNKVFAKDHVDATTPGHAGYRVEMSGPDGPSTSAAGARAVQYIRLVGIGAGGGAPVILATADPAGAVALRSFEQATAAFADDNEGAALPVERAAYDAVLAKVEQFFAHQGIDTVHAPVLVARGRPGRADRAASPSAPPAATDREKRLAMIILGVAVVVAAIIALAFRR